MIWILIFVFVYGSPSTLSVEFTDHKACDSVRAKLLNAYPKAYVDCVPKGYE